MSKSDILNYQSYIKNAIKSGAFPRWLLFFIAPPLVLFCAFVIFESQLARFAMDVFPPSARQGIVFYVDLVHLVRSEILWLTFFFLLALVLAVYVSKMSLLNVLSIHANKKGVYYMMLICVAFLFTTWFVGVRSLEKFPNSSDEYAYLLQAKMFSDGKLWVRAHDLPDFFKFNNIAQHDGIRVSRFPPGWPLLLSVAFEAGFAPFLVNPALGLIALVVFYFFARRFYDHRIAIWSMLALALSGFYIFNAASFFSHVSCLLMTLLFVFNIHLYGEKNNWIYGVLAGFFLAFVLIIRYYTAVLIFLPFLGYLLFQYRVKALYLFFWMGIGSIPCLAYLGWYNYSITGHALVPVTVWAYPDEQLGFVNGHTFFKGIAHLVRWTLMFIYWCSPGLLVLYVVFLWRKIKLSSGRWSRPEDYSFLALAIGYFFYYEIGGNQYGPRFLFEALPFLILFTVSKVFQWREKWAIALLLASMVYPIVKLPFIADREEEIVDQRMDLYNLVAENRIKNAIVLVTAPTSPVRPMPIQDLTRNDLAFANDVIYALELPQVMNQLLEYYPDRSVYRYVRDINAFEGHLVRLR